MGKKFAIKKDFDNLLSAQLYPSCNQPHARGG